MSNELCDFLVMVTYKSDNYSTLFEYEIAKDQIRSNLSLALVARALRCSLEDEIKDITVWVVGPDGHLIESINLLSIFEDYKRGGRKQKFENSFDYNKENKRA